MKHDVSSSAMAGLPMQRQRPRIELARFRDLALLPALALLLAIGAFVSPSFLTQANLSASSARRQRSRSSCSPNR